MKHVKLIAAVALAAFALSACVGGFIVPVPVADSSYDQRADRRN